MIVFQGLQCRRRGHQREVHREDPDFRLGACEEMLIASLEDAIEVFVDRDRQEVH
ncbi:hypothetical protein QJS04_geneDACA008004 [Acorus gramineus]|uniref:Uncharacterized protein n=1 Tax=Acorus gramineus TaxID=55184 RepID=A0AAV9B9I2_ACOGR|nr:hypothetical protein QJS04_geneDACA008004 [Acorus gramineus]